MALDTYGNVVISTPTTKLTFGDVKEFVEFLTQLGIQDDKELLDGHLVFEYQSTNVEIIQCGNHGSTEEPPVDFIVSTHDCPIECG
jgi:hypothetical protein